MAEYNKDRSNSVIDMSLTELAFILFFILLMSALWEISESEYLLEKEKEKVEELITLSGSISRLTNHFGEEEIDYNAIVIELELSQINKKKLIDKEKILSDLIPINSTEQEIKETIKEYNKILEVINDSNNNEKPLEFISNVMRENEILHKDNLNFKGQNINLREKVKKIGNGLDHPPCWADPVTGKIQYLFNIIINERSIEINKGWSEQRNMQARENVNIINAIGRYQSNELMWNKTEGIFQESVKSQCRHYVRIYDHAESKNAFKKYLLGIENHFYKYLSSRKYNG